MVNRKIAVILGVVPILLSACSTDPEIRYVTRVETVTVYKPVFEFPQKIKELPVVPRPDVPTNYWKEGDETDYDKIVKDVIVSSEMLRKYAEALEINEREFRKFVDEASKPLPKPSTSVKEVEGKVE